jgi:asparagine synthase (glutamine-hydrolysing)
VGAAVSGFAGIVPLDGSPVDSRSLRDLTNFLSFRGPDAQGVWCDGPAGFGHALLQIASGSPPEKQPAQFDGRLWIVADARIDARAELIGKLRGKSQTACALSLSTSDAELILHAYDNWGEACVEHLLGDFSFAIWDVARRRLFCARDHFGVKLLYYSYTGSSFVFSNTLNCVRQHPAVSDRLNDLAIADYLLFDSNQDPATTSFADIQRLPPAHVLTLEQGALCTRRYWELSVTTPAHFSRNEECVERFLELLDTAVADRLRTESAGVLMSGGLDSSAVAASAQRVFTRNGKASGLQAYTEVFDSLIPHEERHYAKLVADALKIPIHFLVSDQYRLFDCADYSGNPTPEPTQWVLARAALDQLRQVAAGSRLVLTGDGSDPGLSGRISVHFRQLMSKRQFGRAVADAVRYLTVEGRTSRLYLRTRWRLLFADESQAPRYPGWLEEGLEKRLSLRDRWESLDQPTAPSGAVRPEAHEAMVDSTWPNMFEEFDAGLTGIPVEGLFPFFDLRLVSFLLALPRLPWCCDKQLLREAGRGVLPDAIRLRRKSPLRSDPLVALLERPEASWVDHFEAVPELARYVIRNRIPAVHGETSSWTAWTHLRPLSLNFWLRGRSQ